MSLTTNTVGQNGHLIEALAGQIDSIRWPISCNRMLWEHSSFSELDRSFSELERFFSEVERSFSELATGLGIQVGCG